MSMPRGLLVPTGEHEATRWGFRSLLEMECCDILQPDVGWCGGITELIRISALADARGKWVVPHGSSVYSYHFVVTRHNGPRMKVSALDAPGFGVRLNPECQLHWPYPH